MLSGGRQRICRATIDFALEMRAHRRIKGGGPPIFPRRPPCTNFRAWFAWGAHILSAVPGMADRYLHHPQDSGAGRVPGMILAKADLGPAMRQSRLPGHARWPAGPISSPRKAFFASRARTFFRDYVPAKIGSNAKVLPPTHFAGPKVTALFPAAPIRTFMARRRLSPKACLAAMREKAPWRRRPQGQQKKRDPFEATRPMKPSGSAIGTPAPDHGVNERESGNEEGSGGWIRRGPSTRRTNPIALTKIRRQVEACGPKGFFRSTHSAPPAPTRQLSGRFRTKTMEARGSSPVAWFLDKDGTESTHIAGTTLPHYNQDDQAFSLPSPTPSDGFSRKPGRDVWCFEVGFYGTGNPKTKKILSFTDLVVVNADHVQVFLTPLGLTGRWPLAIAGTIHAGVEEGTLQVHRIQQVARLVVSAPRFGQDGIVRTEPAPPEGRLQTSWIHFLGIPVARSDLSTNPPLGTTAGTCCGGRRRLNGHGRGTPVFSIFGVVQYAKRGFLPRVFPPAL